MDSLRNEKINSYENILGDLDEKILNYKQTLNYYPNKDNTKIIKFDKLNQKKINEEDKSFFDLISKYQLDNSNLQYENFFLKKQNKFLEDELQKTNEKYTKLKNKFEELNKKLIEFEKIKEENLKNINEKYINILNEIQVEKKNIKKDNSLLSIEKLINNNNITFQNLGIKLDSNKILNIETLELILTKFIEENKKLNKKIEEQTTIINSLNTLNSNRTIENQIKISEKNNINKLFKETLNPTLSLTKENTLSSDRLLTQKIFSKKLENENFNNQTSTTTTKNITNKNITKQNITNQNINQLTPIQIKNNEINNLSPYSNSSNINLNKIPISTREEIKFTKNLILNNNNNQIINNPLFGLKSKIEILENMLKDVNVSSSQNDINLDSLSYCYSNNNPKINYNQENNF